MEITDIIMRRRSCRKYTDETISESDKQELRRAVLASPTSKNCKSWQFVFVENKETLAKLSESKEHGALLVSGAALGVVIFGNPAKTDVWIEDASIAASFLMLQAEALGLGACWVQLRDRGFADGRKAEDIVSKLLNAPEGLKPLCVIAIGHPAEQHRPYDDERLPWDQMHSEMF